MLSGDGAWLLVANAGSDELSLFAVEDEGLRLADRVASGGTMPTSVAVHGDLVYVLNNGIVDRSAASGSRAAGSRRWRFDAAAERRPTPTARRSPSARDGRTLVVTERGTDSISAFAVDERGYRRRGRRRSRPPGKTPYGFDFAGDGALIVTEAFGGAVGAAAASSYALDRARPARAGERLGRRHAQRGLLGGRHE